MDIAFPISVCLSVKCVKIYKIPQRWYENYHEQETCSGIRDNTAVDHSFLEGYYSSKYILNVMRSYLSMCISGTAHSNAMSSLYIIRLLGHCISDVCDFLAREGCNWT